MKARLTGLLSAGLLLAGCTTQVPSIQRADSGLTQVQACAIGYDMARTIHQSVALRETVVIAPNRSNACETHALHYLRLAGFAVDESGQGNLRTALDIAVTHGEGSEITALATVTGNLRVARRYRLASEGVYAASAPSITTLPAQYRRKGIRPSQVSATRKESGR